MACQKPMWIVLKSSAFVKDRCLVHSVLKTNCGTIILWKVNYCEKLSNLLTQFIALSEENKQNCWLQQSGATAHTMKTAALLQAFFSDCIVRCGLWPPWSLDLTPPDFFQQGFLKRRVYNHNPRSLKDLKHNMGQEQQTLQKLQKTLWNEWMIIFKNVRVRICCNYTLFLTFLISLTK